MSTNQSTEEDKKIKEYKERFNRWHVKQVDLLTFLINFLFTISIAVSGFIAANQDKSFFKCKTLLGDYSLSRTALLMLAISITAGVVALITRLEDFRRTKEIPRLRREIYEATLANSSIDDIKLLKKKRDSIRSITTNLGKAT